MLFRSFMVKSVADSRGVEMPSFGGYVVRSFTYLVPVLAVMVCLFIAEPVWAKVLGGLGAAALLANDARLIRAGRRLALVDG